MPSSHSRSNNLPSPHISLQRLSEAKYPTGQFETQVFPLRKRPPVQSHRFVLELKAKFWPESQLEQVEELLQVKQIGIHDAQDDPLR